MTFDDLKILTTLRNALADGDYIYPTPVQKEAFSPILSGKDIVGIAQTGTGKTFAYLIPILNQLKFSKQRQPRVLIVVPTRELAIQAVADVKELTEYMSVRVAAVYGGTNIVTQKQMVYDGVDVLAATPGRLYDLAVSGILRLSSIRQLVIDEVDEMLQLGFRRQIEDIMELLPKRRQNLMFSATLPADAEALISKYFHSPHKIEIAAHGTPLDQIKQTAYHVPNFFTKVNLLNHLLENDEGMSKVLVFAKSKKMADRLYEELTPELKEKTGVIHSNKSQNLRIAVIKRFAEGEIRVLVATDLISRGLDISEVSHVLNFDLTDEPGAYIHRIGRTGRAGKEGVAVSFINEREVEYQEEIEKLMKTPIPIIPLPEGLKISDIFTDEEKPDLGQKNYLQKHTISDSKGAFHEKSEKNKQQNSGSPARKRKKHKKPITRGEKRKPKM